MDLSGSELLSARRDGRLRIGERHRGALLHAGWQRQEGGGLREDRLPCHLVPDGPGARRPMPGRNPRCRQRGERAASPGRGGPGGAHRLPLRREDPGRELRRAAGASRRPSHLPGLPPREGAGRIRRSHERREAVARPLRHHRRFPGGRRVPDAGDGGDVAVEGRAGRTAAGDGRDPRRHPLLHLAHPPLAPAAGRLG